MLKKTVFTLAVTVAFFLCFSGPAYSASALLDCRVNVDCSSKEDVVRNMRRVWSELKRSSNRIARARADTCFKTLKKAESLHPSHVQPRIVSTLFAPCNLGLSGR